MPLTAIFDIGKTNKKFFLFDEQYREVYNVSIRLEETLDDDGFPCEDLPRLSHWIHETFLAARRNPEFDIRRVNFSTYGASFVHLDAGGQPVTPLYNYLKPYPEEVLDQFYRRYGPRETWATQTASPPMGMLNSALQLYWLKYLKPDVFNRIRYSLHFPQYCSYLLTGTYVSEYTSIGCHTGMWDFAKHDYHRWIYEEGLDRLLAPIVPTHTVIDTGYEGKKIQVGVGIHDSSAALIPYLRASEEPFLLVSTGTWSITLNPFNRENLSVEELNQDCLNFLRTDGHPVKAARLFLGNEYEIWTRHLANFFDQPLSRHTEIQPYPAVLQELSHLPDKVFKWESIHTHGPAARATDLSLFRTYEEAYHKLMQELVALQLQAIRLAKGKTELYRLYIDGGFVNNPLFIQLLQAGLNDFDLLTTEAPLGSALGAAMVIGDLKE